MLIGHLVLGLLLGALAAAASIVMGFSVWSAFGIYSVAGVLGVGLGAAIGALRRFRKSVPAGNANHAVALQDSQSA